MVLFPYIVRMEEAVVQNEPVLPPPFGSVKNILEAVPLKVVAGGRVQALELSAPGLVPCLPLGERLPRLPTSNGVAVTTAPRPKRAHLTTDRAPANRSDGMAGRRSCRAGSPLWLASWPWLGSHAR